MKNAGKKSAAQTKKQPQKKQVKQRKNDTKEEAKKKKTTSSTENSAESKAPTLPPADPMPTMTPSDAANSSPQPQNEDNKLQENEISNVESDPPMFDRDKVHLAVGTVFSSAPHRFEIIEKPVAGDYGTTKVRELTSNEIFAMRYEHTSNKCKRIQIESVILVVAAAKKRKAFARLFSRGSLEKQLIKYIVCDNLSPPLSQLLDNNTKMSLPMIYKLTLAMLDCINDLHHIKFVHRDIKPSSFAFGVPPRNHQLFITNFGVARRIRKQRSHVPFMGTVKYASRAAHSKKERSQKDDVESWFYVFLEFIDPDLLTWRKMTDREKILSAKEALMDVKKESNIIPEKYKEIAAHINSLEYDMLPKYALIKEVIQADVTKQNITIPKTWEWRDEKEAADDIHEVTCDDDETDQAADKTTNDGKSTKIV